MFNEKIRLMVFSRGTELKQLSVNPRQFYGYSAAIAVSLIVFLSLMIHLFTGLFHSVRITLLEKDRNNLQKELLLYKETIAALNERMTDVEKTGDALRNAVGLSVIDQDIRQVGVGGSFSANASDYNFYLDPINQTSAEIKIDLNKVEREIQLEKASLNEITMRQQEQANFAHSLPSIRPILGANVVWNYGLRIDPFLDKIAPHEGVDIPMPVGTAVLATADGTIEVAKTIYTPFKSYGMEVVIDHGFGYKTRYGHLSKILVKPGQRVKRWQQIGEVGQTGRATGPHLHYEVLNSEKPQNPWVYILDNNN
jgi:murein DD-endopeptidase MepM/ murein hydrolase activator NlpD